MRDRVTHGMALEEAVRILPDYLREAIGTVHYPTDNGLSISNDMKKGRSCSWTDGTVKDKIGAHSYTIRAANDNDECCINGAGGTPGDPTSMTSLRAEHYGVLVIVVFMDIITIIHGHRTPHKHKHYTDSKAVIDRMENSDYMSDKQYDCTDYDIWKDTVKLTLKAKNLNLSLRHVKGHQRETMYNIKGEQGPLTRQATYNNWCNTKADSEREEHHLPAQLCRIEAAEIYLKTSTTLVTASAYGVIYDLKTRPSAEEYVCNKLCITRGVFDTINWAAMGAYMQKLAFSQRIKVMKYIYDWQNVGAQKKLHNWEDTDEYNCPYNCGAVETPLHYLRCEKSCNKMSRMCLEAINKWMITVQTNNGIPTRLMTFLYEKLPIEQGGIKIRYNVPQKYEKAVEEQERIGWDMTIKGLLSITWSEIQEIEYERIRKRETLEVWFTGEWWAKHLIKHIIFWALNEWQRRNEHLHKVKKKRTYEKKRRECHEEVMVLYQQQEDNPVNRVKRYFRIPLIDMLQQNPSRQRQWIDTIRSLRDKAAMQNSKSKV